MNPQRCVTLARVTQSRRTPGVQGDPANDDAVTSAGEKSDALTATASRVVGRCCVSDVGPSECAREKLGGDAVFVDELAEENRPTRCGAVGDDDVGVDQVLARRDESDHAVAVDEGVDVGRVVCAGRPGEIVGRADGSVTVLGGGG